MRGVNDRTFLNLWQIIYRATCPDAAQARWRAGDVDWCKDRHTFTGGDYAFSMDVHTLRRSASDGRDWVLMVVVEHWWDQKQEILRSLTWARAVKGSPHVIAAWLRSREQSKRDNVQRP